MTHPQGPRPTDAERAALADRLAAAVPEPPALAEVAARSAATARRTRTRRRAGLALAAAVAVAAAIGVPALLGRDSRPVADHPPAGSPTPTTSPQRVPTEVPGASCVGRAGLDHRDFAQGTASWVRFCPVGRDAALVPDGVLTHGVAALVEPWQGQVSTYPHSCPMVIGGVSYRLQVGFTDGTVAEVRGRTDPCQGFLSSQDDAAIEGAHQIYDGAVGAFAADRARGYAAAPAPRLSCPSSPHTLPAPVDGASAAITPPGGMLLALPATGGLVCSYDSRGHPTGHTAVGPARAERIRLAAGSSFYDPRSIHVGGGPRHRPSYVVTVHDKTGTARSFSITGTDQRLRLPGGPEGVDAGMDLVFEATGR